MRVITAAGALGAAIGAALLLTVRFVTGSGVDGAVALRAQPRAYVDFLPTDGPASRLDTAVLWPVVLGTGLVAGLLVGLLAAVAERVTAGRPRTAVRAPIAASVLGAVLGLVVALELHLYGRPLHSDRAVVGWYSYSPLGQDGILYGGRPSVHLDGTSGPGTLLLTGAVVGALVGIVVGGLVALGGQLRRRRA